MASGSKPQEEGTGLPSRARQRRWTSPMSSLSGVMPVTFTAVTAADQNNTYYSCMFPGITQEPRKSVPGKTDRLHPVSGTSSFWIMRIHRSAAHRNQILLVSYNMSDGFKKKRSQKDTTLMHDYHISILSPQTWFSPGHWIFCWIAQYENQFFCFLQKDYLAYLFIFSV